MTFLRQASEDYLTFEGQFELKLDNATYTADAVEGNRSTMVIIQDGSQPRYIRVSTPARLD